MLDYKEKLSTTQLFSIIYVMTVCLDVIFPVCRLLLPVKVIFAKLSDFTTTM